MSSWSPDDSMFASDPLGLPIGIGAPAQVSTPEVTQSKPELQQPQQQQEKPEEKQSIKIDESSFPALGPVQHTNTFVPRRALLGESLRRQKREQAAALKREKERLRRLKEEEANAPPVPEGFTRVSEPVPEAEEETRRKKKGPFYKATVKSVLSGDTVVLVGAEGTEKVLGIDSIVAPRFRRARGHTRDEPFAWQAREFLRRTLLGKAVHFRITFVAPSGREVGDLVLVNESGSKSDVAVLVVAAGFAEARGPPKNKPAMFKAYKEAIAAKRGRWAAELPPKRKENVSSKKQKADGKKQKKADEDTTVESETESESAEAAQETPSLSKEERAALLNDARCRITHRINEHTFFEANKNTPLLALVDQVRDGSTLRVELLHTAAEPVPADTLQALQHTMLTVYLAGASSPSMPPALPLLQAKWRRRHENGETDEPMPTTAKTPSRAAAAATAFTEARTLQRLVFVTLRAVDKQGNLYAEVCDESKKSDLALSLLQGGHATFVPWTGALVAEKQAMQAFQKVSSAKKQLGNNLVVKQVRSGDSLVVADADGQEYALRLASVRAPLLGTRFKGRADEPFARAAREFLRAALIGETVSVCIEYTRGTNPAMVHAAVTHAKLGDVALALVRRGFATTLPHRPEESRASNFLELLAAERECKQGLHSAKELEQEKKLRPAVSLMKSGRGEEETESLAAQAQKVWQRLQRECRRGRGVAAVVEHVFSASRFEVYVPCVRATLLFSLAAVAAPFGRRRKARNDAERLEVESGLAEEAMTMVRDMLLHKDVELCVEECDRGLTFVGALTFGNDEDLACMLLEQGLLRLFASQQAKKTQNYKALQRAETVGKKAHVGLWNLFDPFAKEKAEKARTEAEKQREQRRRQLVGHVLDLGVTECVSSVEFYAQVGDDPRLDYVEKIVEQALQEPVAVDADKVKKGSLVLAEFEGEYCRAKVVRRSRNADSGEWDYHVQYVDYGNLSTRCLAELQALPEKLSLSKVPPLARRCLLAGLSCPSAATGEDARFALCDLVLDQRLQCTVQFVAKDGTLHLTCRTAEDTDVSENIVAGGYACVSDKTRSEFRQAPWFATLQEAERCAEADSVGYWYTGDWRMDAVTPPESLDTEETPQRRSRGPHGKRR